MKSHNQNHTLQTTTTVNQPQNNYPRNSSNLSQNLDENNSQNDNINTSQTVKTFASVTKRNNRTHTFQLPKKDQGIIINVLETSKRNDFIYAVGKIVGPKNVVFGSKISNNRICIYLSNKELVDQLVNNHRYIIVDNNEFEIRRLISPAQRVIISNVCPTIPHEVLEHYLKYHGLQMVSPINFLKAGIPDPEYSHIFSFRRQTYIKPNEDKPIPASIIIEYEETAYRVFLSTDTTCFKCKQNGHMSQNCPNQENTFQNQNQTTQIPPLDENQPNTSNTPKRAAPGSDVEEDNEKRQETNEEHHGNTASTEIQQMLDNILNKNKKSKPDKTNTTTKPTLNTSELLEPIRDELNENPEKYSISFDTLAEFLENVQGVPDPLEVAREYTDDVEALINTLSEVYPKLDNIGIKTRITRLKTKIKSQIDAESRIIPSSRKSRSK